MWKDLKAKKIRYAGSDIRDLAFMSCSSRASGGTGLRHVLRTVENEATQSACFIVSEAEQSLEMTKPVPDAEKESLSLLHCRRSYAKVEKGAEGMVLKIRIKAKSSLMLENRSEYVFTKKS